MSGTTHETQVVSRDYLSEAAAWGDFNGDGIMDLAVGPFWYEGPGFTVRHPVFEQPPLDPHGYGPATQPVFVHDFNGDGLPDLFCTMRPTGVKGNYGFYGWNGATGWQGVWYENPGPGGGLWTPHPVLDNIANEALAWTDINGDGRPDLVYSSRDAFGYAAFDPARPDAPWTFHAVSGPDPRGLKHGIGAGDITGNGKPDLLSSEGWWEHPDGDPAGKPWTWHPWPFAVRAVEMHVCDLDGDGLNDVITVWDAHAYGLVWHRQRRDSAGAITWERHDILPDGPVENGFQVSQLHALALGDTNGDGVPDLITGKRYWAHGPDGDAEPDAPAVLAAFETERSGGDVRFHPRVIHADSGAGNQIAVLPGAAGASAVAQGYGETGPCMLAASGKKGVFIHRPRKG